MDTPKEEIFNPIGLNIKALVRQPFGFEYRFKSREDILDLVDILVAGTRDVIIEPVTFVYDPREMVRLGLWPLDKPNTASIFDLNGDWYIDWLEKTEDEARYWNLKRGRTSFPGSDIITSKEWWIFRTLDSWKRIALETANSIPLLLYAPELIYKGSRRPITDMSLFRGPRSHLVKRKDIASDNVVVIAGEKWNVLPVTRYAKGMTRGLYFDTDTPKESCGTFFYYEPESTTLLAYKTSLTAFNKIEALRMLNPLALKSLLEEEFVGYINREKYELTMNYRNGIYPANLLLTPNEAIGFLPTNFRERFSSLASSLPQRPHYAGKFLDLYAAEDFLDQPLCTSAKEAGLDVVILTNMIGSFQIVTEVLDTRPREHSFRSLLYIVD